MSITLTAAQIAEGWIAHDGSGFPEAALAHAAIEAMTSRACFKTLTHRASALAQSLGSVSQWRIGCGELYRVFAWRPSAREPGDTAIDPNADMLARDTVAKAKPVPAAPAPRVERCNLLTVADIPRTGFSLWGAQ